MPKGSRDRTENRAAYEANYEAVFGKPKPAAKTKKTKTKPPALKLHK